MVQKNILPLQMLVYYSSPTYIVTAESVHEKIGAVMKKARINNPNDGITGALLCSRRHFLQVLEGNRVKISQTFSRITPNTNHEGIVIIGSGPIKVRQFSGWNMGFFDESEDVKKISREFVGSSEFDPSKLSSSEAVKLMRALRDAGTIQPLNTSD